jgi:hypothetical protein
VYSDDGPEARGAVIAEQDLFMIMFLHPVDHGCAGGRYFAYQCHGII